MPTPGAVFLTPELADYFNNASDAELLRLQRGLVSEVAGQMTRMNMEQRRITNTLDRSLSDRLFYKRDGSDIAKHSQRAVDRAVRASTSRAQKTFERRADFAVLRATLNYTRTLVSALEARGIQVPRSQAESIARRVASSRTERFGKTRSQLADSVTLRHQARVNKLIQSQTGGPPVPDASRSVRARDRIQSAGSDAIGGRRTPGGSTVKDMGRILSTEALASSYEASHAILQLAGLDFAYRRSVGGRANNGRGDICDDLNSAVVAGIGDSLLSAGINPDIVDFRGLYPVGSGPDYPHSSCRCYWEPLII